MAAKLVASCKIAGAGARLAFVGLPPRCSFLQWLGDRIVCLQKQLCDKVDLDETAQVPAHLPRD
eukprot:6880607-Lingulodinium_polyedra.AAC.1